MPDERIIKKVLGRWGRKGRETRRRKLGEQGYREWLRDIGRRGGIAARGKSGRPRKEKREQGKGARETNHLQHAVSSTWTGEKLATMMGERKRKKKIRTSLRIVGGPRRLLDGESHPLERYSSSVAVAIAVIKLREQRKAKGFSLRKMGHILGVDHHTVSRWETGKTSPAWKYLERIEEWLREQGE